MVSIMTSVALNAQQSDYSLIELKIDVKENVDICEVTLIIDDVHYPVHKDIKGSQVTLYLAQGQDYSVMVNNDFIDFHLHTWDVRDDRDISISADVDYRFVNGVLVFDYPRLITRANLQECESCPQDNKLNKK